MYKLVFVFILTLLSGCAARQQENNHLADLLQTQSPQFILQELQKDSPAKRDYVQYQLNVGFLQFIIGDFPSAITTLSSAKKEMENLAASSISENIEAGSVNETLRSYSGYPTDRVMVHNILALSYLFNNDIYGARVEMLQADLAMQKLSEKNSDVGQLASAHMLAAIIYEILDELSNSLISYRDAAEIIEKQGLPLPLGIKQALLRVSYNLGADKQYQDYQQQFPDLPLPERKRKNQLFAIYFDGVVSHKIENTIMVPSGGFKQLIRISMPAYPQVHKPFSHAKIRVGDSQARSEIVDDLELSARKDLEKEYPSILLLTTTRAIAKYVLVDNAQKQDPLLGLLANIATILTEDADLRSWNMLPSNIQFLYLEPQEDTFIIDRGNAASSQTVLGKGTKNVLLINSLSNEIFHYQQ